MTRSTPNPHTTPQAPLRSRPRRTRRHNGARLRVLQLSTQSLTAFKFTMPFGQWLADRGHDVVLACSNASWPDARSYTHELEASGLGVAWLPMERTIEPLSDARALWETWRLIQRGGFDVVHTHNAKAGFLGRLAGALAGVPLVVHTNHGLPFQVADRFSTSQDRFHRALERLAAQVTDRFFVVSQAELDKAATHGIAAPERMVWMGQGIDLATFTRDADAQQAASEERARLGLEASDRVIGVIARQVEHKGLDCFLDAAARIAARDAAARFVLVGDGPDRPRLEAQAARLGLEERVRWAGHVKALNRIRGLYAMMDVFMLPTRWESFGVVFVEAMAMGVPVIGPRQAPIVDVVQDGETGLLVEPDDAGAYAEAALRILGDDALSARFKAAGRARVEAHFAEARIFERMGATYAELARQMGWDDVAI